MLDVARAIITYPCRISSQHVPLKFFQQHLTNKGPLEPREPIERCARRGEIKWMEKTVWYKETGAHKG